MNERIHVLYFISSVIIFIFSSNIYASIYYVDQNDPSANDQNIGTREQPWKTITKANQILTAGDIVYIKAGNSRIFVGL